MKISNPKFQVPVIPHADWRILTLVCGMLVLILGCGEDQTSRDNVPPVVVRWVPASADDMYPQQGIRADTTSSDRVYRVRLEWYQSPEPDVLDGGGYLVYRTPENAPEDVHYLFADLQYGVNLTPAPIIEFLDIGDDPLNGQTNVLAPDDTERSRGYYWEIIAYDSSDNRSEYSERIYYRMIPNPTNLTVTRTQANVYRLIWNYEELNDQRIQYWYVRIYSAHYGVDSAYFYVRQSLFGNYDIGLTPAEAVKPFVQDCTYVWQLNVVGQYSSDSAHVEGRCGASMFTKFRWLD